MYRDLAVNNLDNKLLQNILFHFAMNIVSDKFSIQI